MGEGVATGLDGMQRATVFGSAIVGLAGAGLRPRSRELLTVH